MIVHHDYLMVDLPRFELGLFHAKEAIFQLIYKPSRKSQVRAWSRRRGGRRGQNHGGSETLTTDRSSRGSTRSFPIRPTLGALGAGWGCCRLDPSQGVIATGVQVRIIIPDTLLLRCTVRGQTYVMR